jgi:hypothetical protein
MYKWTSVATFHLETIGSKRVLLLEISYIRDQDLLPSLSKVWNNGDLVVVQLD